MQRRRSSASAHPPHQPKTPGTPGTTASATPFEKPKEPFTINNIPIPPPGSSRRPSVSSSIAPRIPKQELRQLNALTAASQLSSKKSHHHHQQQNQQHQPHYPLSSNGGNESRKHSIVQNSANNNHNLHHQPEIRHRNATLAETWFKPRRTLSESTSKLNEMMASNLTSIEKSNKKRKSIFSKTQPKEEKMGKKQHQDEGKTSEDDDDNSSFDSDDDDDDSYTTSSSNENAGLEPSGSLTSTSNEMSLTFDQEGKPQTRPSRRRRRRRRGGKGSKKRMKTVKIVKKIRNEKGEEVEVEVEEEVTDSDYDNDEGKDAGEEEAAAKGAQLTVALLEQAAALVGILAPPDDQDHRRAEKTGPTEEELEAERQRLWELNNRIRPADEDYRDFICPKRWSAVRRIDAKLDFFRNSTAATARLADRMKFYKQVDRETTIAARDSQEFRHRKLAAMLSGAPPPPRPPSSSRPRSARSWTEERKRREQSGEYVHNQMSASGRLSEGTKNNESHQSLPLSPPGPASGDNAKNNNSSDYDELKKKQQQQQQGQLKDFLRRPQSARVATSASASFRSNLSTSNNVNSEQQQPPPWFDHKNSNNNNEHAEDNWVQRNYGEFHHIPIVEIPPRTASEWHKRNEVHLFRRLRDRPESFRSRKLAEYKRENAAFEHQHRHDKPPPKVRIPIL